MDVDFLAQHQRYIPTLAQWFHDEWGYLYPQRTLAEVQEAISERTNTDKLPLALVAIDGQELLGTVCLKQHDMDTRMDLTPWLAGLYVADHKRGKGIGRALVAAIETQARKLGIEKLYLYTPESEAFYLVLGWQLVERMEYHGYPVSLMEKVMD